MALFLLIAILVILFLAAGVEQSRRGAKPPIAPPAIAADEEEVEDPVELARNDPVEALRRFGIPEDAERLAEDGIDLGALGYRPRD